MHMARTAARPAHAPKPLATAPTLRLTASSRALSLLLLALATTGSIDAAAEGRLAPPAAPPPAAPPPWAPALRIPTASYETVTNPDYYSFELGTTLGAAGGDVYIVCVYPWAPYNIYNSTTNTLTGYQWDLFLDVAQAMGLSYETRVMGWGEMQNGLGLNRSDPGRCDIGPCAVPILPANLPMTGPRKLQLSMPTYRSGFGICVKTPWAGYDKWSFGGVFTAQLWAALLGSAGVLALLTYAAERDHAQRGLGKTKYPIAFRPGMYQAVYNCVGKLFNVIQDLKVTSLAGKLIAMGWGFLALVASTTYTAGITATLTVLNFKTSISSVADLSQYRVVTYTPVVRFFLRFGFIATGLPWVTDADNDALLDAVASGDFDALVIDYPWLRHMLASRCDLVLVGQPFHTVDVAVGFNAHLPSSFVDEYNVQLMNLKQGGVFEELEDRYLPDSRCPTVAAPQMVVTLKQLEGLWIILGAFVSLAVLLLLLPRISSRWDPDVRRTRSMFSVRRARKNSAGDASPSTVSGHASGRDDSKGPPGTPQGGHVQVELHANPAFGRGQLGAEAAGPDSHLEGRPAAGSGQPPGSGVVPKQPPGPGAVSEQPGAVSEQPKHMTGSEAPTAQAEDVVVLFSGDAGPVAGAGSGPLHPLAELPADSGAPAAATPSPLAAAISACPGPAAGPPGPRRVAPKQSQVFLELDSS